MTDDSVMPDPGDAADLPEFIEALGRLRMWAGAPSYRTLAKRVGPLLRPPRTIAPTTVIDVFQPRRRRLDFDLVVALVRALGLDEEAAGRWRAACARVHHEVKADGAAGVFRQLPPDLSTFTGRETALRELMAAAATTVDPARAHTVVISAIEGMAGVGKTQLALHAAHELVRAGRFADVQLYVNLRGFDPDRPAADPAAVLETFLRQLEVPAQQIPRGVDARAAMFRDRIHGRHALVVLDDAADEEQVRDLIPAAPTCLVLVTSRRTLAGLDGAVVHRLDVFDPADAVALLALIAGADRVAAEPEAAREIAALCGHLPLAIALAGARLRSRPAWPLTELATRLRSGISDLSVARRSLSAVFDLSYRGLDEPARRVFRLLGLYPGLDSTVASVTALADLGPDEAGRILESLCDEHLLQQKTSGRYELHDLLHAYAAERAAAEMTHADRAAAVARVVTWYAAATTAATTAVAPGRRNPPPITEARGLVPRFHGMEDALAFYEQERFNLVRMVETAAEHGLDHQAWYLPVVMQSLNIAASDWSAQERLDQLALRSARRGDDAEAEAWVLRRVGTSRLQGRDVDPKGSLAPLTRALELFRETGNRLLEAHVLSDLAWARARSGEPEPAFTNAEEALAIYVELDDAYGEVGALSSMAMCLHELGRPQDALELILRAIAKSKSRGYHTRVVYNMRNLGFTHIRLEQYAEAQAALEEAVEASRGIGEHYIHLDALNGIARSLQARGRHDEALERYRESLDLLDSLPPALADRYRKQLETSTLRFVPPE